MDHSWLDTLAQMDDGRPAWPVARENGISLSAFRSRLRRGWSGQCAATLPIKDDRPRREGDPWEEIAVRCGVSRRAYRSRRRAGFTNIQAAEAWDYTGIFPPSDND